MALVLTDNLKQAINQNELVPTLVAKIDGISTLFGNVAIKKYIRIGDPNVYIGDDWFIGGYRFLDDQHPYISFSSGTTTKISQKLDPSRGQGSSVSSMTLAILDVNNELTQLVSPGVILSDVIGRTVTLFLGAQDTSWPEDYNVVFRGVIQDVDAGVDTIYLNLANTDEKKRTSILPRISSELTQDIDYKSVTFQSLLFRNRDDVQNLVTITYSAGGSAGSEVVSIGGGGYSINVQIANGVSTASQIKSKIENHDQANQLVTVKIVGDSQDAQSVGSATLSTDTTIDVLSASEFIVPSDELRTFVIIDDEMIEYTGITGNQLTGCIRASNATSGQYHGAESTVDQAIMLSGVGIDIALKLMLSKGPTFYAQNIPVLSFEYFKPSVIIESAIFFKGIDLVTDYGVSLGDKVTISGATVGGNNVIDAIIVDIGDVEDGSYIVIENDLFIESVTSGVASFKSQFNVLPIGMAMKPVEVDVEQHVFFRDTFLSTFQMDLIAREITDGKGFLEKQVYLPMTCFSVPRKGRSSMIYTVGPLPMAEIVTLNSTTVSNPEKIRVKRSSNENFFNQVQFDYDYDPVKGTYLSHKNYPPEPNQVERPVGVKPIVISSQGLRSSLGADAATERASNRWLRRYERGAEFIKNIQVFFSIGYQLEIGDIVAVDYSSLKITDFATGTREGAVKLMEVMNKTLDNKTGDISVDVVNTTFGVADRFGMISPSSEIGSGSTTTKLILNKSFSTKEFHKESRKWKGYSGQPVIVHSEDWSVVYETVLRGFDNLDPQGMSVDELPSAPLAGWIVQCPEYPSTSNQNDLLWWKQRHAFMSPRVSVVAGVSQTRFTVSALDVGKFFVGSIVRVHNFSFTIDSPEVTVTEIIGNDILVGDLGFVPSSNEFVDLIGFSDKGQSYRVV